MHYTSHKDGRPLRNTTTGTQSTTQNGGGETAACPRKTSPYMRRRNSAKTTAVATATLSDSAVGCPDGKEGMNKGAVI